MKEPDAGDGGAATADTGGDSRADATPPSDAALALAVFEGIYSIQDVTLNPSSCAVEGPSVLATQTSTLFVAVVVDHGTSANLGLVACTDVADCESKADMDRGGRVTGPDWLYSVRGAGAAFGGDTLKIGSPTSQGQCANETIEHASLTGVARGMLRLEVRITDVPAHAAVGGACDPAATQQAAAGVPCARLKVITGNYQQPL